MPTNEPPLHSRQEPEPTGLSPLGLWRAVRKNWLIALGVAATVIVVVTFYTLGKTKIYEASGTIQFDPQPPRPLGNDVQGVVDLGGGTYWNNQEYYETQYEVVRSMNVASRVVRILQLNKDASFIENAAPGAKPRQAEITVEAAAQLLRNRIDVEAIKKSRIAVIRYRDADPDRAQRVLRTVMDTYVQQNLDYALDSTNSAGDWLRGQLDKLKGDLESNEMSLHNYKLHKNILSVSMDDQANMLRAEMQKLNEELTIVRAHREAIASRKNELDKVDESDPSNLPVSELLNSVVIQELRKAYLEAARERDALVGEGKGENHPALRAAVARVEPPRTALIAEIRNIKSAVSRDLSAATAQAGALAKLAESAKQRALDLNLLEIEYNRLRRSKDNTEKLYSVVLERTKESDLTRMLRINNIRLLDAPLRPTSPVAPRVPVMIALGALAGVLLGLGAAIGREQLDRSVKTPDDVERVLNMPFLGLLPEMGDASKAPARYARRRSRIRKEQAQGASELVVHEHPSSGVAEAARAVRTNIMFMAPDKPHRRLLITSAGPMEGKTTVACCVSIAMAQAGQRVLLLDCDLRRPRVHRIFGRSNSHGVTTMVLDPSTLDVQALATHIPNLFVLTSGPIPPNPAEMLQSEAFDRLLDKLSSEFDRVIIDSPPVVPVTDAAVLSTRVDGTVLVIRAFMTSKDLARQAVRALRDVTARTVGAVLNAVDLGRQEYGYYHYYYYKAEGYQSNVDAPVPGEATPGSRRDEQRPSNQA